MRRKLTALMLVLVLLGLALLKGATERAFKGLTDTKNAAIEAAMRG